MIINIDSMSKASTNVLDIARRLIGDEGRLNAAIDTVIGDWDRADLMQEMGAGSLRRCVVPFKGRADNDRSVTGWRTYQVVCAICAHLSQVNGHPFDGGQAQIEEQGAPYLAAILWP